MGLFGIVFIVVALVLIGIGLAIGIIGCLVATALVALGVVSSSFLVGLRAGRASAGFRAFLLQCGILAGIPAGAICAWAGKHFYESAGGEMPILIYGALGGALSGVILALMLDFVSSRLSVWASARVSSLRANAQPVIERRA